MVLAISWAIRSPYGPNATALVGRVTRPDLRRYSTIAPGGRALPYFSSVGCRFESCRGRPNPRSANVWRQPAEHVTESLTKGDRAVVEVEADEVAPSPRGAIAKPERAANGKGKGEVNDEPNF